MSDEDSVGKLCFEQTLILRQQFNKQVSDKDDVRQTLYIKNY